MKLNQCWKYLGSGVSESISGVRIHTLGLIQNSAGEQYNLYDAHVFPVFCHFIKIMGGNRKRALMATAESITQG